MAQSLFNSRFRFGFTPKHKTSSRRLSLLTSATRITLLLFLSLMLPTLAFAEPAKIRENPEGNAVILLYHRFGEDNQPSTSIRLTQFDAQLDYLTQNHFHVWPLSKLVSALKNHQPIPPKTVVLTVDDAWKSVYTNAFPRLVAHHFPMTIFVNTDPIDKGYHSNMTWAQMREMQSQGIEFANHTKTHDFLTQTKTETFAEWQQRVQKDIEFAQQRLQTELGPNTNQDKLLSYPYGEFSEALANLVQKMGYVTVAQNSGAVGYKSNLNALMRFPMSEIYGDLDSFTLKVNTQVLPVEKYKPFDPLVKNNPPKLTLYFSQPQKGIQCFNHKGERLTQQWISPVILEVQDSQKLMPPRDRYACTQKADDGHWRWFSHSWIIEK